MHSTTVDVLIPIYNAETTLEEAVDSIQSQSYSDLRISLIHDASTDSTPHIISKLGASDARVVALRQENSGIVDALNLGWRASDAPLIARHDADDIAAPDRFHKQVAYLTQNPSVVAVSGSAREIDIGGKPTGRVISFCSPDLADPGWVSAREPYLLHPFLMLRRAALDTVGGYRHVFHAEDADLYWRLQEFGRLTNMPDILGDYRFNPNSVSSRSILNGRVQSLSSQLAAISATRRRSGQPDLVFPKYALKQYEAICHISKMVELSRPQLSLPEQRHLCLAVADKLNRLASYRPYDLEISDCRFIASQFRSVATIQSNENRRDIIQRLCGTVAALVVQGRLRAGVALCPAPLYIQSAAYVIARIALPRSTARLLRKLLERLLP